MPLPALRYELQVGGQWTDVTGDVYERDAVTTRRGQQDGASRADPARATLTLNNRSGKYSPRNPMSPYFGLIGRNTPFRMRMEEAAPRLVLDGSVTGYVSTPDAAALDITGDLDLRAEAEINWSSDLNQTLIGKWDGVTNQRSFALRVSAQELFLSWSPDGTASLSARIAVPTLPDRAAIRATLDVDNGAGGRTVTFYWAPSLAGPWIQIGSPVTQTTPTSIYASTAPLRIGAPDSTTTPPRVPFTGSAYRCEVRAGIDGTVVAAPNFTTQTPGATGFTDSAGRAWTLAGTAELTRWRVHFPGEVSSWPARWDLSGNDVWVPIEAAGPLRRLGQGVKPLDSTLRRRVPSAANLLAYWPMEEDRDATQAYSPVPGVQPMVTDGLEFASDDSMPGSAALPKIGTTSIFGAQAPAGTDGAWRLEWVYRLDAFPAAEMTWLEARTTGTYARLQIRIAPNAVRLYGITAGGTTTHLLGVIASDFLGEWNRIQLRAQTTGSSTTFHVNWRRVGSLGGGLSTTEASTTAGHVTSIQCAPGAGLDQLDLSMGHLSVIAALDSDAYEGADDGFWGETAHARMRRLCQEEAVPLVISGATQDTPAMGPQRPETLLELLQQAADVDGGILAEQRDQLALRYRTRSSLYSQTPALALSYTAPGEVPPGLEPVDDDSSVRNDITVSREGGSSARAVLETGALSVQAPPAGVGRYDESLSLVLATDTQAEPIAYWRLWLGTWDEARYPTVTVDLAAAPHLATAATAVKEGDRITISNLPSWLPPGTADLMVTNIAETISVGRWVINFTCIPAGPWNVAIAGGDTAVVREDFEDTTYTIAIAAGGNLPWTRTSTQAHAGTWSLRSGAITNNQTSDAVVSVPAGATTLSFWYRTSSEASGTGFEGDRLLVLVDGVQALRAQGTTAWTQYTATVTGKTVVTFRYAKDNSASSGEDAVYIDDLAFTIPAASTGDLADTDGSQLATAAAAADTSLSVAVTAGPLWTAAQLPVSATLGGEQITVTAVSGTTSPQTLTAVRAVNGVTKAHASGTALSLTRPAIAAL
ncbi:hypothetical protein ABVG11_34215 [Streptomyces sp. HD1123-B1]|uniref:hypothetical protein n=1 Tax=Streptomyces huangiella TaxID=3228804 RepID=UPI003D7C408D